jgi:hypothetical protein
MGSGPRNQPVEQRNGHNFAQDMTVTKRNNVGWNPQCFGRFSTEGNAKAVHFDTDKRQVNECYTTLFFQGIYSHPGLLFLTFSPVYYAVIFNLSPRRSLRNSFVKKFQIKRGKTHQWKNKKYIKRTSEELFKKHQLWSIPRLQLGYFQIIRILKNCEPK